MDPILVITHTRQMGLRFINLIFISFLAYAMATLAWLYCYRTVPLLRRFGSFFMVRQIGETLSILNPTGIIGGDALRSVLIDDKRSSKETISSVTASRGLLWMSYLLVCVLGALIAGALIEQASIYLTGIIVLILLSLFYFLFELFFGKLNVLNSISSLKLFRSSDKAKRTISSIATIRKEMKGLWALKPYNISIAIGLFMLHYLCGAYEFQYILSSLDIDIPFHSAIILEVGTSLVRSIAMIVPGQIGIEEYSNKLFLQVVGVNSDDVWISVSVIRRLRQLFWIFFALLTYAIFYHRKKGQSEKETKPS